MFWRKKSYFDNSAPDIKNRRKQPCQVRYMAPMEQFFVTLNVATPDLFASLTNGKTDRKLRQAINPSAGMLWSGLKKPRNTQKTCFEAFWEILENPPVGSKMWFSAHILNYAKIPWNTPKTPTKHVLRLLRNFWKSGSRLKQPVLGSDVEQC